MVLSINELKSENQTIKIKNGNLESELKELKDESSISESDNPTGQAPKSKIDKMYQLLNNEVMDAKFDADFW